MYTEWCFVVMFFFKQKTAYEMRISDWSSDVCSSDLVIAVGGIVVRQLADMVGDPEDFLDQDEPAAAFAFRLRVINGNVGAVVHRHADHLAHRHYPSPVRIELVEVPFFLPPFGERTVLRQAQSLPPRWRGPNGRGIVSDKSPPSPCIAAK